jgi:hypothetical protein
VRSLIHARVELGQVLDPHALADGLEPILRELPRVLRILVAEEPVVIGPELALVGGAEGRVGGVERLGSSARGAVDGQEVVIDELDLSSQHVVGNDLRFGSNREGFARGALEVFI